MEILKRNMVSVICGVIALLSIVAVFVYPLPGLFQSLGQTVSTSAADFDSMRRLNSLKPKKPLLDPLKTQAEDLDQFPNTRMIDAGEKLVKQLRDQCKAILDRAREMNVRRPLVPEALPNRNPATFGIFKFSYFSKLDDFRQRMNAITAPNALEVQKVGDSIKLEMEKQIIRSGGVEVNRQEIDEQFRIRLANLPDELRKERAKNYTVYLSKDITLDTCATDNVMPRPEEGRMPMLNEIWAAQLSLWIEEDVVQAIIDTNNARTPGAKVEGAAIKRLVYVDIPKKYITKKGELFFAGPGSVIATGSTAGAYVPPPLPVTPDAQGASETLDVNTREFAVSPTGRICNPLYDVMHFTVTVDCDARYFRDFMASLMNNRFITILRADLRSVDRDRELLGGGYMYGPQPVIRLVLRCEAIFFRSWCTKWMPAEIRKILEIPEDTPDQSGQTTAMNR